MHKPISGIYGILPADIALDDLLFRAESALNGGIRVLQIRDKKQGFKYKCKRAGALRELTLRYHATLFVNDSAAIANAVDADGVHLGKSDIHTMQQLRTQLSDDMVVGVTCRADAVMAKHALEQGADYISLGAIFATTTKADVPVIGLPRLQKARTLFPQANIVAIGGIDLETLAAIRLAGADSAAVISSLFESSDIESMARMMVDAWHG
ncbi:MAG: thiamine phosphate synthase [Zetaproteobacteria bacterium]|nr:thiamine phosphate synthase [Zetaproteobacteria bacterium]